MPGKTDKKKARSGDLPDLDDFSTPSIQRAVRNESLLHPFVLYPAALGMLSGFAALLYDLPLLLFGMGGLLAVGAGTSVVNYFFRNEAISGKYLEQLSIKYKKHRQQLLEDLSSDLEGCTHISGAQQYGRQGVEQFKRVEKKYLRLRELLEKKFKVSELAYGSFLGAAEQVHLSVLDNLRQVVSLMHGADTIDPDYIAGRRKELESLKNVSPADEREFEALQKRLELRDSQLDNVNTLLTENEESMTVMDETIAAIAALQTGKGLAEVDLQTAMTHLREIADRTKLYEHNGK